jgi:type III secretory pathway component EscT
MELALRVAAPFVLLMLMVEMGLGLLGRYAPQLNVFFLALPLKALVLLLLLMFYSLVLVDGAVLPEVAQAMRRLFTGR